ncbi:aldo/keto reductase [Paenibacillus sp. GYB003]|uniref:aldo/keto reductase n=1 Tax=Paenibacillus sp. GYB003 TaxID=2994392 RepID=UPI002F96A6B4
MQTHHQDGTAVPSKLTLGTVQLGMPYGIHNRSGMPSEESSFELLRLAVEGGIASFDTAAAYGQSESILGRFFQGAGPASPIITTKVHLKPEPGASRERIERQMRECVEGSLERLRMTKIPILMLHNTDVMEAFGPHVTDAFRSLLKEGLIGRAGISVSHNVPDEYRILWPYLQDDTYEAVQIPLNVLDHRPLNNGCLDMLARRGTTVFVRSVFLQGLLYMSDEELPPKLASAAGLLNRLRRIADSYAVPLAQLAVSFVRDLEGVDSLVIGAETKEQVRDNIALAEGPPIPETMREELRTAFRDVPETIVTPSRWK